MSDKLEVLYFTDPFCSWCWASEPQLLRLQERYGLKIEYVMGGLVKDIADFYDPGNHISGTAQVAPHWRMVNERTGQPIDERVMSDITDPNWSTWPACIAVKAAQLQGEEIGERYLRRLRRAVMTERTNVSERDAMLRLAKEVEGLDVFRLQAEIDRDEVKQAFYDDLKMGREYGATGFPTLLFIRTPESGEPDGLLVNGHRPTQVYEQVLGQLAPELKLRPARSVPEMLADYGPLTTRELVEITDTPAERLTAELNLLESVRRIDVPHGELWALA